MKIIYENYKIARQSGKEIRNFTRDQSLSCLVRANDTTLHLLEALEYFGAPKNLKSTTFLPLHGIIGRAKYVHTSYFKWCPCCFKEQEDKGEPPYIKLIWHFEELNYCPVHRVRLVEQCPNCGSFQKNFGVVRGLSTCASCGNNLSFYENMNFQIEWSWLSGNKDIIELIDYISKNPEETFETNCILASFQFISHSAKLNSDVKKLLDKFISESSYRTKPFIEVRFLAWQLNISLLDILCGPQNLRIGWQFKNAIDKIPPHLVKKKRKTYRNHYLVNFQLKYILGNSTTPLELSLKKISQSLGTSVGYLEYRHPELIEKLVDKRYRLLKEEKILQLKKASDAVQQLFSEVGFSYTFKSRKSTVQLLMKRTKIPRKYLEKAFEITKVNKSIHKTS